jgi:hypothetical protein
MSEARRDHVEEGARSTDWEAELRALLKKKGYEVAEVPEVIGGPRRRLPDEPPPPDTTEETA